MKEVLSSISGILFLIGFVPYIKAIVRGQAKPAKATWIIWAVLNLNVLIGMALMGTANCQITFIVVGTFIVAGLALRRGKPGWTTLDKYCGLGAVIGVLAVWCLDSTEVGVVISLGAGFAASFPTFVNAWENPENEDRWAWMICLVSCGFALAAVPEWSIKYAMQPITQTVIQVVMVLLVWVRPRFLR